MASADYTILTPERVSLQYDIAGVGSRGAAAMVDTILQFLAMLLVATAISASSLVLPSDGGGRVLAIALISLGVFVITGGYFMVFEILWNGQTPGKRLVGVRVIRENGYPLRPVDAVIRNLVRIVDWLPVAYAIGVTTMLLNSRSRRLGDFASGTIVIREGQRGLSTMVMPTVEPASEGRGFTLSNQDATLVRDFLVRRATMAPTPRKELALRLAEALARRYSLAVGEDPERFLEQFF